MELEEKNPNLIRGELYTQDGVVYVPQSVQSVIGLLVQTVGPENHTLSA